MSEPYWVALGPKASPVDYVGNWAAGTAYVPGQVVRHNGADHIAVNPSTGQTPLAQAVTALPVIGIGTSLPTSPFDGQEYILTDSLTAPTYSWRFRYVASITDAYKWVFIGGTPKEFFEAAGFVQGAAYQGTYTTITLPRAGVYDLEHRSTVSSGGAGQHNFRWRIATNTPIAGAREHFQDTGSGNSRWLAAFTDRVTIPAAGASVGVELYSAPGSTNSQRHHIALPVRVA